MNTRKMLARLGPKTPQLTRTMLHSGGKDALTPQDIAATLAYIRVQPGRDLYEFLWVPNKSSNMNAKIALTTKFAEELCLEQERRQRLVSWERVFPDPPKKLCLTENGLHHIRAYGQRLANACLNEMTKRNDCQKCRGYGQTFSLSKMMFSDCSACLGSGTIAFGQRDRAKMLGIRWESYSRNVEQAYIWLLGFMREQEQKAADEHWRALSD